MREYERVSSFFYSSLPSCLALPCLAFSCIVHVWNAFLFAMSQSRKRKREREQEDEDEDEDEDERAIL